jgi:hypothetical protein
MPVRSRLKSVPSRFGEEAIDRIVAAVGLPLLGEKIRRPAARDAPASNGSLQEDLNFERIHFASFDIVGRKGAPLYRELIGIPQLNQFLGGDLAEVYEKYFGKKAGRSRAPDSHDLPSGPYVRFAIAVMEELGQEVSAHTVEAALKAVRRRKKTAVKRGVVARSVR